MQNKLVSIAMCTYNGERYIKEQLESILNQTYSNLEIIISDDCSNDATIDIIKHYQKADSRIKLFINKQNLGFVKNFENVISLCNGEYIALADQDDIWKKNKIEKFILEIKDNILIYSDAILIDDKSRKTDLQLIRPHNLLCKGKCSKSLLLYNVVSGNTMMFHKNLVQYILPIHPNMNYHDSWIAFVATNYSTITYTDEPMTYYRRYSEQITHKQNKKTKNILTKIKYKTIQKNNNANLRYRELTALKSLSILNDLSTIKIIDSLILHYKNYESIIFNFHLYNLLKQYKNDIFATLPYKKRNKAAFRLAKGLRLHIYTAHLL